MTRDPILRPVSLHAVANPQRVRVDADGSPVEAGSATSTAHRD